MQDLYFGGVMSLSSLSEHWRSRQRIERRVGIHEKGAAGRGEDGGDIRAAYTHALTDLGRRGQGTSSSPGTSARPCHPRAVHGRQGNRRFGRCRSTASRWTAPSRVILTPGCWNAWARGQLGALHLPLRPRERQDVHRRALAKVMSGNVFIPGHLRGQPGHSRVRPGEPLPRRSWRALDPARPSSPNGRVRRRWVLCDRPVIAPAGADAGDARPELRRDRQVLRGALS